MTLGTVRSFCADCPHKHEHIPEATLNALKDPNDPVKAAIIKAIDLKKVEAAVVKREAELAAQNFENGENYDVPSPPSPFKPGGEEIFSESFLSWAWKSWDIA